MRGANPLVQAPHVPKRAPDWGQFVEGAAASQSIRPAQGGRQAAKTSAWGQVSSKPYQNSNTSQQAVQSTGPLKPSWLSNQTPQQQDTAAQHTQQQQQPQQHNPSALQNGPCEPQNQQQAATNAAPQVPQKQKAISAQHRPAKTNRPALASAQRGLGALRGNIDTYTRDVDTDSLAALDDLFDEAWGPPAHISPGWQQQASGTTKSAPAQLPQGQVVQQQHDQHRQQQHDQQRQQQQKQQQQQQQQGFCVKPVAAIAAWGLDDTDDVQLPDSWFDSSMAPVSSSIQAAPGSIQAAPGSEQAAAPTFATAAHMDWGIGAGKQQAPVGKGVHIDQHATAVLQQQRQQPVHLNQQGAAQAAIQQQQQYGARHQGQQQQQQQMQHQHPQGSHLDPLQQQTPWQQVPGQHTPSANAQQVHEQQPACQQNTQALQQQQQQQRRKLPWQQQQQEVSPQVPQAKVRQRRAAAVGSVWSTGVNLAALNRVPAAAPAASSLARDKPPAAAAATAAAAAAGDRQPAQKPQNGAKKAVAKGSKKDAKKGGGSSSSSAISMEFVPKTAAEGSSVQPELHQMDLFQTLKRARRNKQREQQQQGSLEQQDNSQDEMYQQQQEGSMSVGKYGVSAQQGHDKTQAGSTAAKEKPAGRKRKRDSAAAAAAAAEAAASGNGSGHAVGASGGRGRGAASGGASSGGSRTAKTAKLSKAAAAAAAALEGAVEDLDTWSLLSNPLTSQQQQQQQQGCVMLDASMPGTAVWQQLQQALHASEGVALGLLYNRTVYAQTNVSTAAAAAAAAGDNAPLAVQYFTSLQAPSKLQLVRLSKAAAVVKKQAARSAAAAAEAAAGADGGEETGQSELSSAGVQEVVGLAIMPVLRGVSSSAAAAAFAGGNGAALAASGSAHDGRAARNSSSTRPSYYIHLQQQQQQQGQQQTRAPHVLQLLQSLLCAPDQRPCVCCGAKDVLCSLMQLGLQLPAASCVNIIDPELLGWLSDPQCIQDTKDEACYTLEQQLGRCNLQVPAGASGLGPLQRLHTQLSCCLQLIAHLHTQLSRGIAGQAIKMEMQVCTLLAKMQACGVACAPSVLAAHRPILASRLSAIKASATQLVGRDFNLSSASQLAKVLYEDLHLVPPAGGGGRGAAKTHLPTNEATLKQLAQVHQLPALVLEHRCILNAMSKWIDAAWVQQAAQQPGGRVHCTWQQAATATGRLSSCGPNLQAVTKYTITAQDNSSAPAAAADPQAALLLNINVRDAFVAPPGKLLLSADYSQIELRMLAHFSEDVLLRQILSQETGDMFNMIAAALQRQAPGTRPDSWLTAAGHGHQRAGAPQVSAEERERAKRVVYGIVYGQTPFGLAQSLADQGISTKAAEGMIDSFLARFPGVRQFMQRSITAAHASGAVSTLMGRRRPIVGLAGDFQKRSEAERKVVNSQIQGSAADLIKLAMCSWESWAEQPQQQQQQMRQSMQPQQLQAGLAQFQQREQPHSSSSRGQPAARLIAQIHDELLFEVSAPDAELGPEGTLQHPGQAFLQVAAAVKAIMEGAAPLAVPLRVKLAWGNSWGSLAELQL